MMIQVFSPNIYSVFKHDLWKFPFDLLLKMMIQTYEVICIIFFHAKQWKYETVPDHMYFCIDEK